MLPDRLRARRRGGIVLVTSMVALSGSANVASYAATKAFDWILAQSLWHELAPHGVDALGHHERQHASRRAEAKA